MASLEFFGAANTVTGSMHILHLPDGAFALDCGLFQGRREESIKRNQQFPLRPDKLKGVLLSHAHIDHSGKLPALAKNNFSGNIYATAATADLCNVMLRDSAHIQEEDARFWNERRAKTPADRIEPLYKMEDADQAISLFVPKEYNVPFEFADGARATFIEAGHILGSACVLIELTNTENAKKISLLYTGDLGRFDMPILRDPANPLPQVDYLITESTYADRVHHNPTDMKQRLATIINETRQRGGKVIIPAFSVGRTQNVVYYLSQAVHEGLMDKLPIYVDSPMSTNATEVFKNHPECYDSEARDFWWAEGDIFGQGLVKYITDVNDSKALNAVHDPCVIISASGMCEAGRILHHLKNNITDEKNTVIIVGFMAQHTLGRRLAQRNDEIKIYGRMYERNCQVKILNGFSAHADQNDLTNCLSPLASKLKTAFCVHGENHQPIAMKKILDNAGCRETIIPKVGYKHQLI